MTQLAGMRTVLHTDEHFRRHQTWAPQTSLRPSRAALSPALCFYLRLIRSDRSANIDHGALGKILPPGLRGDYRLWTQLMQTGCVCVHIQVFLLPYLSGRAKESSSVFLGSSVSNHLRKRDIFKETSGQTGSQAQGNTENRL